MNEKRNNSRQRLGQQGEEITAHFVQKIGYQIIDRNWRCRFGELDIIANYNNKLVFIEVRTRRMTGTYGSAEESITMRKQMQVKQTAQWYLHQRGKHDSAIQFDVVTITMTKLGDIDHINHITTAF